MSPLHVREHRAAFGLSGIYDPQVECACDTDITALARIVLPESQTAVAGPEGSSSAAMLIRPLSAHMRRAARARVDHLDRVST